MPRGPDSAQDNTQACSLSIEFSLTPSPCPDLHHPLSIRSSEHSYSSQPSPQEVGLKASQALLLSAELWQAEEKGPSSINSFLICDVLGFLVPPGLIQQALSWRGPLPAASFRRITGHDGARAGLDPCPHGSCRW